jgi:BMFP domain-containing protein YqiC
MSNGLSAWNDVQRLADEVELQVHLAGMDARDRWNELEPRLEKLEHQVVHSGERAVQAVAHELHEAHGALRALRDELLARARGDFLRGW